VFVTNKGDDAGQTTSDPPSQAVHDGDAGKEQGNPPPAADPATEQLPEIHGRPRPLLPAIPEDTSRENLICGAPIYVFCGAWVVLHRIFATKISILWRTSTCATE
jgi:hypothetical protein